MNTRNIKNASIFLSAIIILSVSACKREPLKEEIFSFISKENFYRNANDAKAAITACYSVLAEYDFYGRNYVDMTLYLDDQCTIYRNPFVQQQDNFNIQTDHSATTTAWAIHYKLINNANTAIGRIPTISMSADLKNQYLAEARYLRAFCYFNLVRLWGSVPLSLEEISNISKTNVPKKPVADIYAAIKEDLLFAEQYLPATRPAGEFGRATLGAAKTLLADVYLTTEDWAKAATKAKEVIDGGKYQLLNNFEDIFNVNNENNAEIIFPVVFDGENKASRYASWGHAGGSNNANCFNGVQVWSVDTLSDMWVNQDKNEPRRKYTVYTKYKSRNGDSLSVYNTSRPFPAFGKFNAPNETYQEACPLNSIVYRYTEVFFMYAEALSQANGGPNAEAYEAVNKIRRRAYKQPVNQPSIYDLAPGLSAQAFRNAVLREKSFEFVAESKRIFDLLRTKQFPQILVALGKPVRAGATLLPIPQAELNSNSALTPADQNPGY